jgi:60S ribosome subunit biogenesis protein NIP7
MTHYTKPAREETTAINRALDRWGAYKALSKSTFMIKEGKPRKVCILSPALAEQAAALQPYSAGLEIGELGKQQFVPTVAGASLLARSGGSGRFYVRVGENAEKLVLYGRDVMGDSILEAAPDLDENELVIITNKRGEAIGIGRTRFAGKSLLQKGRITITTLADAGRYLRDEDENRSKMARRYS